jgi:NADH-quinone oxidoreductase subunit C
VTDGATAVEFLRARFPDAVVSTGAFRGQHWVELALDRLPEICRALRDEPPCAFDVLLDVTAVHWPRDERPFELVYHLYSHGRNDRIRLKVRAAEGPKAPSLAGIWRSAEWNEREAFDMFGIVFEGHPDLRRILMHDDYTDFPLRKEFPLYRG